MRKCEKCDHLITVFAPTDVYDTGKTCDSPDSTSCYHRRLEMAEKEVKRVETQEMLCLDTLSSKPGESLLMACRRVRQERDAARILATVTQAANIAAAKEIEELIENTKTVTETNSTVVFRRKNPDDYNDPITVHINDKHIASAFYVNGPPYIRVCGIGENGKEKV